MSIVDAMLRGKELKIKWIGIGIVIGIGIESGINELIYIEMELANNFNFLNQTLFFWSGTGINANRAIEISQKFAIFLKSIRHIFVYMEAIELG